MKNSKSSFFVSFGTMIFLATIIAYGFYIDSKSHIKFASPTNMGGVAMLLVSVVSFAILILIGFILAFIYRKKNPSAAYGLVLGTISAIIIFFIYLSML